MEYPVSSPSRTHRYIHPSLFVCTARSMSEEIVERPSPLLLVPPSLFLHCGGERNGREWRRRASLSCPPQNPFPPLLLAAARPPHQCTLDLRPLPSPPSRWTERARTHACATKTRTHIFLEILANLARDATRFALSLSFFLSLRTSMHVLLLLLARLSCTCTNQGSQGSSSTSWMHPFYRRPQNTQAMRFFLGEGRRDHYLHASPSPKMRSSNRFANIIPIQSAERRTRDAHTRGFPSSERAGRLYFLFSFYFYANVFSFSRVMERSRKNVRRKRGGGIFDWFFD